MNEKARQELGRRIKAKRISEFGTSTAAERAAQVNNATFKRAEQGLPVRDDRLAAIVKALWPKSGGDVNSIDAPAEPHTPHTAAPAAEGLTDDELLTELARRLEGGTGPASAPQPAPTREGQKNQISFSESSDLLHQTGVEEHDRSRR